MSPRLSSKRGLTTSLAIILFSMKRTVPRLLFVAVCGAGVTSRLIYYAQTRATTLGHITAFAAHTFESNHFANVLASYLELF
ncbi:hypothetical protein E2C01_098258 [Portunus trituberculatus]|uniref:Uncharacterized protein n=1 Tax=Portunus trituberculatus TaxID=210409 RepID=A0A5B7JXD1_PORTR|nr:hypothetical protein [Portunus trituberculatus]